MTKYCTCVRHGTLTISVLLQKILEIWVQFYENGLKFSVDKMKQMNLEFEE